MSDKRSVFEFCAMQPESLVILQALQEKKTKGEINKREQRQLYFLKERQEEGSIWLMPALIFAAANQNSCREFFWRASEEEKDRWQQAGIAWMRQYPGFLDRIGWQERSLAVRAAGFFVCAQARNRESLILLRRFFSESWSLLWSRIRQKEELGIAEWEELLLPWEDSEAMECAMAAVFLSMAALQKKPVRDMDQCWRTIRKLKVFTQECLKQSKVLPASQMLAVKEEGMVWPEGTEEAQKERLEWLFTHFRNPQRLAYLKEKGRISSEWMDTLFGVMEKAGLPRSACESMQIGGEEVMRLLECFTDRASERQYITFLLLYTVSRELVKAGQVAAQQEALDKKSGDT